MALGRCAAVLSGITLWICLGAGACRKVDDPSSAGKAPAPAESADAASVGAVTPPPPAWTDEVPDGELGRFNRGVALLEQRRYREAEAEFLGVAQVAPTSYPAAFAAALARYYQGGDMGSAVDGLERMTQVLSDRAEPPYLLGHVRLKLGKGGEALDAFRIAAKRFGRKQAHLYYSLGLAASAAGNLPEAEEFYRKSVETEPLFASGWYSLAQFLLQQGREAEGNETLARFEKVREDIWAEKFEFRYRGMGDLALLPEVLPAPRSRALAIPTYEWSILKTGADAPRKAIDSPLLSTAVPCGAGAGVAVADFDGDGDLDIVRAACGPVTVELPEGGLSPDALRGPAGDAGAARQALPDTGEGTGGASQAGRGPPEDLVLLLNDGKGTFSVPAQPAFPPREMPDALHSNTGYLATLEGVSGVAAGDLDGDGDPDLVLTGPKGVRALRNRGDGTFEKAPGWGISGGGWCATAIPVDFDHDGNLDVYVARLGIPETKLWQGTDLSTLPPGAPLLFENDGKGTFRERAQEAGLGGSGHALSAFWIDLDRDNDVDLLKMDIGGATQAFLNLRDGTFAEAGEPLRTALDLPPNAVAAVAADLDGDGMLDLAFSLWSGPAIEVRLGTRKGFERPRWADEWSGKLPAGPGLGLTVADPDGDGRPSLVSAATDGLWLVGPFSRTSAPDVLRIELPPGGPGGGMRGGIPAMLDGNGSLDLVVSTSAGAAPVLNRGRPPAGWLRVTFEGQLGSNREGLGTMVDARVGALWQSVLMGGGSYLGSAPAEIYLGFGDATTVEFLRASWPGGIRQPIVDLDAGRVLALKEKGLKSSCPLLFAWDGEKHRFLTDLIGSAALGLEESPGVGVDADVDEMYVLPAGLPAAESGLFRLRLVEPLEEILFTDRVRLLAVDHRFGTEIAARERYQFTPPRDETGLLLLTQLEPIKGAVDGWGNNVVEELSQRDGVPVETFELSRLDGLAETHELILDLGEADPSAPVLLVLDGWVRYPSMEEMAAATAAGVTPFGPALDVDDSGVPKMGVRPGGRGTGDIGSNAATAGPAGGAANSGRTGSWRRVWDYAGHPAGLDKTVVLNLSGQFRNRVQRVRLSTNLRVYWDRIRVDRGGTPPAFRTREVPLAQARLWRSGYPLATRAGDGVPLGYDGDSFRPAMPEYIVAPGRYTRLGDVTGLVAAADDRFVVSSHGEAIDLEFRADGLPPVEPGHVRTYAFLLDGWMKDQEPGTLAGDRVEPLPWRGMGRYPPAEGTAAPGGTAWTDEWNTRDLP